MASAKDLIVKPISAADANRIVKSLHYSGKVVQNSQRVGHALE
jgi:(2Fe-2S) ferredoxin